MGNSKYIQLAEENEKRNLSVGYLIDKIDEIAQNLENQDGNGLDNEAKKLKAEIETYKNEAVKTEREQWERYATAYQEWFLKHRNDLSSMEAGMTKPNKPHYKFANND